MKCPKCKRIEMSLYTIDNGVPTWVCPNCQKQKIVAKNKDTDKQKPVMENVEVL